MEMVALAHELSEVKVRLAKAEELKSAACSASRLRLCSTPPIHRSCATECGVHFTWSLKGIG